MSLTVAVQLKCCSDCHHVGHSGAFTPGGAKDVCDHADAVVRCPNGKAKGDDRYHWKYRVGRRSRIPSWCPLKYGSPY